ncbi:MAG: tetratricopeptide repeat protein [Leptospirillum sp.]
MRDEKLDGPHIGRGIGSIFLILWLFSACNSPVWARDQTYPLASPESASTPVGLPASKGRTAQQEKIEKLIREKRFPEAYKLARQFQKEHPKDLNAIYLLAYIEKKVHFLRRGLLTVRKGLAIDPGNVDLGILEAEILIRQGRLKKARAILEHFQKTHPNNPVIRKDLLKTYFPDGLDSNIPFMDQHLYSLGEIQSPFRPDQFLVSTLPRWSLNVSALGINYSGGAAFVGDAQVESPMAYGARFIAGRTEYMGFVAGQGNGLNSWTYAGIDSRLGDHADIQVDAGDTSLERAGLYGHFFYNPGLLTIDVQGVDNMVWGDFGQAIQMNGMESGVTISSSLQLSPRLSMGLNYWYYDYSLNDGSLPYGNLHNSFGYFDYQLTSDPEFDIMAGYDDWTIMAESPATAALVPEIMRQQYVLVALNGMKQYDNGLVLSGQIGGYNDFYNHLASGEGSLGIRYPVTLHWSLFGNAIYFQESTLYSGPSEELMLGINFLF